MNKNTKKLNRIKATYFETEPQQFSKPYDRLIVYEQVHNIPYVIYCSKDVSHYIVKDTILLKKIKEMCQARIVLSTGNECYKIDYINYDTNTTLSFWALYEIKNNKHEFRIASDKEIKKITKFDPEYIMHF